MIINVKKFIIITSIFKPTEAVKKFSKMHGWTVVVVGDKKTPVDWGYKNVIYLSPKEQENYDFEILKKLPWNHYSRKMIGYLYAISHGAEVIYDTDDDNIPLLNWHEPIFEGKHVTLSGDSFVNIYSYFTNKKVWPRGLPLKNIITHYEIKEEIKKKSVRIWQFLANNDPDVDAIYRLTNNMPIIFKKGRPLVLGKNLVSPINSQNTFFHRDAFPLLYLPAFVTFRFTDILRGLVAQPILWTKDFQAGFDTATVIQKRNEHDYLKDFESEIPVYLYSEVVTKTAQKIADPKLNFIDNLLKIYSELSNMGIVPKEEIFMLKAWIMDVQRYQKIHN